MSSGAGAWRWNCPAPGSCFSLLVERYSSPFVEAGKGEKVQQILDTFGIDDAATGREGFRKLIDDEGPIRLKLVSSLGLTPE